MRHHLVVDEWSRGHSLLHARAAQVKITLLLVYLVMLGTARLTDFRAVAFYLALPLCGVLTGRLPLIPVLMRVALVLPFAGTFAALTFLAGDGHRALNLLLKSTMPALAVLVIVATTPMPKFLAGAQELGAPRFLILVIQFLYRYLFVVADKANQIRLAAACRGGLHFAAAGGAAASLFGSSYARAEGIHRAMLARGFTGWTPLEADRPRAADYLFLCAGALPLIAGRMFWIL
jgi:cobalt/nickel transport system permease protein